MLLQHTGTEVKVRFLASGFAARDSNATADPQTRQLVVDSQVESFEKFFQNDQIRVGTLLVCCCMSGVHSLEDTIVRSRLVSQVLGSAEVKVVIRGINVAHRSMSFLPAWMDKAFDCTL